jgi:hypothetical protein
VLLSSSWANAMRHFAQFAGSTARYGLVISYPKTRHMVVGSGAARAVAPAGVCPMLSTTACEASLGSRLQADGGYEAEVSARLRGAGAAYAQTLRPVIRNRGISYKLRGRMLSTLMTPHLTYGAEVWVLPPSQVGRLTQFYNRCVRFAAGSGRWQQRERRISDAELRSRLGVPSMVELLDRSTLRWAGHVARMGPERLPRQALACTVPEFGEPSRKILLTSRIRRALTHRGLSDADWATQARDRAAWRRLVHAGGTPQVQPLRCPFPACGWSTGTRCVATQRSLNMHLAKVHPPLVRCAHQGCSVQLFTDSDRAAHAAEEHPSRLQCQWCNQSFNSRQPLASHVYMRHRAGAAKRCPVCPFTHELATALTTHIRSKHYRCQVRACTHVGLQAQTPHACPRRENLHCPLQRAPSSLPSGGELARSPVCKRVRVAEPLPT